MYTNIFIHVQFFFLFPVPKSALSQTSLCLMVRRALCLGVLCMSYKATEVFRTLWKLEGLVTSNFEGYNWQAGNHTKDNEWLDAQMLWCLQVLILLHEQQWLCKHSFWPVSSKISRDCLIFTKFWKPLYLLKVHAFANEMLINCTSVEVIDNL